MQVLRSRSTIPGFNLAAEEYLFSQRSDEILFLYVNAPTVVIGCHQVLLSEVDPVYCSAQAVSVCRRMSGGGAVYHDGGNLNYCFIKNRVSGKFPLGAEFLQPILQVLHQLNIPATIGQRKDLWLNGKKISGTASHVGNTRELHHGTLLYDADLGKLQRVLLAKPTAKNSRSIASVSSPVINIKSYFSTQGASAPVAEDFFQLFTDGLLAFYDLDVFSDFTDTETALIQQLCTKTYESEEWTKKR